jgi:hypothetical protein
MFRVLGLLVLVSVFSACNDNASAEQELDTLEQKLETGWDSTKAEVKELKDSLKSKWENRKDSADKDSLNN